MVTLTSLDALAKRHEKRFADMKKRFGQEAISMSQDLQKDMVRVHSGSPSGQSRTQALKAADFPFARRHGVALWQTPPLGSISGNLLSSLMSPITVSGDNYTVSGKSVGVDYAQFVYSPSGTSKMVPRLVLDQVNQFATFRVIQAGRNLMANQLRLL